MNNILISVIVPIYNVQDYLETCLKSICGQTYKNLEIILVNDGSSDSSLDICKKFSETDNRITIINKPNGGLSDARNAGLDIARGDYIGFVDADDYINYNMYETLLELAIRTNSDISVCRFTNSINFEQSIPEDKVMSVSNAIPYLYDDNVCGNYAWNKLYKATLFSDIRFPKGKYFEDAYVAPYLFLLANNISFTNQKLYFYNTKRQNRISDDASVSFKLIKDHIEAYEQRLKCQKLDKYVNLTCSSFVTCLKRCKRLCLQNKVNYEKEQVLKFINSKIIYLLGYDCITFKDKIQLKILLRFNKIPILFYISLVKNH